jgi:hypothetical protein
MAILSFKDILVHVGFDEHNAFRQQLILDSLIAEKIKLDKSIGPFDQLELKKIIKSEIANTYSSYLEHVSGDLNMSKQLLLKDELAAYLKSI